MHGGTHAPAEAHGHAQVIGSELARTCAGPKDDPEVRGQLEGLTRLEGEKVAGRGFEAVNLNGFSCPRRLEGL